MTSALDKTTTGAYPPYEAKCCYSHRIQPVVRHARAPTSATLQANGSSAGWLDHDIYVL